MATKNRLVPNVIDQDIWITNDGESFVLNNPPTRVIISEEGTGVPPIQYISQRGPYQHGESLRDYFLQPRIVQLIVRESFCDRQAYWNGRAALLDMLRPNRGINRVLGQGTLRKIQPNGTIRDLTAIIQQGPTFAPRQAGQWDEFAFTETLRFIAHDPTYFEPVMRKITFGPVLGPATFPLTFPYTFLGFDFTQSFVYAGTWISYPTIIITGPFTQLHIENVTTGQFIEIAYAIPAGHTVTIDLTYGRKTVIQDDGTNLIGYITPESDLVNWQFVQGTNNLLIRGFDTATSSKIEIQYRNRYIGI